MNKLQERRTSTGFTRQQLSELSGVNVRMIERYEQGERDLNGAKLKTLLKLCKALECNLENIIDDEETIELLENQICKERIGKKLEEAYMLEPVGAISREKFNRLLHEAGR